MQKFKSNITTTSGAAVRGVPVHVLDEAGNPASLYLDRAGTVAADNPLTTGADGTFYFYAVNGRYSLRTTVEGATITDTDVVLLQDPEEITVAGPIAEAVQRAESAAHRAETAVEASGIPALVATVQNAVVDASVSASQALAAANNAAAIAGPIAAEAADALIAPSVAAAAQSASNASAALAAIAPLHSDTVVQAAIAADKAGVATAQAVTSTDQATASTNARNDAQAAKTAAEAARDAALIQAGVYVDEPTGRAAVADGQAFKVQGNGAVAAYEYRRTSSAASVLIAAYPSVDGVWQYRGEIDNATDLNTLTKSGSYRGVNTSSYPNTPDGFSGKNFMLIVVDGFGVNSRFQLWRIQEWGNPNNVLQRWFDINNPTANAWVGVIPSDGSVTAGKLTTDFNYRGYASSGSANSYLKAGVYMVNAALTDMPAGAPSSGYLEVTVAGDGFLLQRFSGLTDQSKRWGRYIRTTTSTYGAWLSAGVPDDGSVGISKLTTTFSNRGYATADANNFTSTGIHLVTSSISNLPAGAPTAGYLEVVQTNDGYLVQTYSGLTDPSKVWRRYIRVSTSTYGAWGSVSGPFAGKKIAFIGDSITHLGDYPARVAARLGCNSLKLGFSGCRMAQHTGDYDALSFYRLADAISSGVYTPVTAAAASLTTSTGTDYNTPAALLASTSWSTVDYMVVLFGTNDWGGSVPLGLDADATGGTFKGAINYAVNKILTAYPNIKMLFMAPPWRARMSAGDGLDADTNPNGNGVYLLDFVDAVKSRANANKLPAIDLYRESGINKYNQATLLADGLHPAPGIGYQLIADKVSAGLLSKY